MRITIIGSTGQLGTDLMKVLHDKHEVTGLTHKDIEVTDYGSCSTLKKLHPDVIINTAAFHKIDQCEEESPKAFAVNAVGAKNLAAISEEIGAVTVYVSTDYVFDGSKNKPYMEDDAPNPINTYGISKLAGELYTRRNFKHYVVRVASLFGVAGASGKGGNFVETMMAKAKKNELISVVDDMWMNPTYTKDAATTMRAIFEKELPYGIYHVTNRGHCTWFQFAREIFKLTGLHPRLTPTQTDQQSAKSRRPLFSALRSAKLAKNGLQMRQWQKALTEYLHEKGYLNSARLAE
jgi:dTDP-4-dehydrorhamnose reductase